MKVIESNKLNNKDPVILGEQTGVIDLYDGLTTPYSSDVVILSGSHVNQIESFVNIAASNYSKEETLVQRLFSLPSLITRVDCTIGVDGDIHPYEMEDSPSGQGITDLFQNAAGVTGFKQIVRGHFEEALGTLPTIIISNSRTHGTDDALIFGSENYIGNGNKGEGIDIDKPVIVKAIPGDAESRNPYMRLQSQTVAPLVTEGDKTYAEKIGLLKPVSCFSELNDELGCQSSKVIKARLGSMALGVSIYLSPEDRKRFGSAGSVTASRLEKDFLKYNDHSGVLAQEFIPPIQIINNQNRTNAILRIFVLLSVAKGIIRSKAIGGCYVARNEIILHGASNAVSGAVLVQ